MDESTPARTALITGVSGFAGRHLAALLLERGWRVEGTVRSNRADVPGLVEHVLEIDDERGLIELLAEVRPGVVFHLAAIVDTVTTPSVVELYRVNTVGTAALTEAIKAAMPEARLVFASSSFVYGRTAPEEQPVTELQPLQPLTPYGASKAAAEAAISQFGRSGGHVVIARSFQHTGYGHKGAYALSDWAQQLASIERAGGFGEMAVGNLEVERDYLDVRDVASAYVALAERGRPGEIYNVCSGVPVTMRAMLDGLIEEFGVRVEITVDPSRLRTVDQPVFVGDNTKLRQDTGWEPDYSSRDALATLREYWRAALLREQTG
jgi:GDP-4-dehydro-6-deoxy-D-mannose reductase